MRSLRQSAMKVLLASAIISSIPFASANPYPRLASESPLFEVTNSLELRACAVPCGYYGQLCCQSGQYCYTDSNNQAQCGDGSAPQNAGGNGWQLYTTTYVVSEYQTVTTVWSSPAPAATAAQAPPSVVTVTVAAAGGGGAAQCNYQLGQIQCGSICCAQGQFCNSPGVCVNNGGTTPAAGAGGVGGQSTITAAIRPTSISTYTVITTGGVTTTVPFLAPASATGGMVTQSSTGSHLSGGAIAGIVIGVLAAIIILILLIICCCARGLLDIFRPKRKVERTETFTSRHHSGGSAAAAGGRRFPFFGRGGGAPKRKEEGKGWLGVAGVLAALAVVLGLKRRKDRREEEEKQSSAYTYSDYTYSYDGTSASSASSDRRSRRTGFTRSDIRSSRR